jgi:hypothetical protein
MRGQPAEDWPSRKLCDLEGALLPTVIAGLDPRSLSTAGGTDSLSTVMRGLDPRIHDESQPRKFLRQSPRHGLMDCRVKPGNDKERLCVIRAGHRRAKARRPSDGYARA